MDYIILDLEWNQSNSDHSQEEERLPFEIIEIGAIKLNSQMSMVSEFNELIKPQVYHEMHYITRKLIHLQMEELERGKPFVEVMKKFFEWCGDSYMFCTWGPLDLTELQRNMDYYEMPALTTKPLKFYDVQKLFSIAFEDKKSRRALEYAVDFLKIKKDIPFHRAFSDAYYTAKVLTRIEDPLVLEKVSFDVYVTPKTKKEEIHIEFNDYIKYITREFEDKAELLTDKEIMSTKCYLCHRNIKKKLKWFTPNGKHYYSVSFCNKHGNMKSKIRIRRAENEKVYAVKTSKFITEEEMNRINGRKERTRELRKQKRHKDNI